MCWRVSAQEDRVFQMWHEDRRLYFGMGVVYSFYFCRESYCDKIFFSYLSNCPFWSKTHTHKNTQTHVHMHYLKWEFGACSTGMHSHFIGFLIYKKEMQFSLVTGDEMSLLWKRLSMEFKIFRLKTMCQEICNHKQPQQPSSQ